MLHFIYGIFPALTPMVNSCRVARMSFSGIVNILVFICSIIMLTGLQVNYAQKPNIVIIYTDDVGFGDIGAYGNKAIATPNMDALAARGLRFTEAYTTAATCTPSRYSLLTGRYNWRQQGTGVARGNAGLVIDTAMQTLPEMLRQAGYTTAMIGKWHLGLGGKEGPDWNKPISPGVLETGFDYTYFMPSTNDRVPCVFIENNAVVNLDPSDPITVSYTAKVGNEPTGKENPELLTMKPSHGHDQTIINGISRIGYMSGGKSARWRDQDIADIITGKAKRFIAKQQHNPFFIYFNPHDIHVPRTPNERFEGKSGYGLRGDALLELDWTVGEIVKTIDSLGLSRNTLIILSSDNGPVIDDGYIDRSVEEIGSHKASGPYRGGKYSIFDAGTHVPMIAVWPGIIPTGVSQALFSQVDLFASLAMLTGGKIKDGEATDSRNHLQALLGKDTEGREHIITSGSSMAIRLGPWKYIKPSNNNPYLNNVNIETGANTIGQLYRLDEDKGEVINLAAQNPDKVAELKAKLEKIVSSGHDH